MCLIYQSFLFRIEPFYLGSNDQGPMAEQPRIRFNYKQRERLSTSNEKDYRQATRKIIDKQKIFLTSATRTQQAPTTHQGRGTKVQDHSSIIYQA